MQGREKKATLSSRVNTVKGYDVFMSFGKFFYFVCSVYGSCLCFCVVFRVQCLWFVFSV